jgi:hypothetical protein
VTKAMAVAVLVLGVWALPAHAGAQGDWKATLRERLIREMGFTAWQYPSFGAGLVGGADDAIVVTKPGMVYLLGKDGLVLSTKSVFIPTSTVINGEFEGAGGRRRGLDRILKAGEPVYLISLSVNDNDVSFGLLSKEQYEYQVSGTTNQYRLRGNIKFAFARGYLASAPIEELRQTFSVFLRTEAEANQPVTKTIELGQTLADVEATFGKPETIVKLGEKVIYTYKTMKVTFVRGRVSDVQ